jgi:hypothetical protein
MCLVVPGVFQHAGYNTVKPGGHKCISETKLVSLVEYTNSFLHNFDYIGFGLLYFHLNVSRQNLFYCLTMYIVPQVAYALNKDFQILFLSHLVSFPNLCKNFVLNQQLNLTSYSKSANYVLPMSLIYTLYLYFL